MMTRTTAALTLLLGFSIACQERTAPEGPVIESEIVAAADIVAQLDTTRTFEYLFSSVEPESLLVALWRADLPISRAWLPLDDRCLSPLGPHFTAELLQADPRIVEHDFLKGTGRLACATTLEQFTISD
jgi:hypothetical protein